MTDALQLAAAIIILIVAATTRWAWNRFWAWAAHRIAIHVDRTLGPEPTNRYRDLDTEYRQLVLDKHNGDTK